jgi:hypothetical protein
MRRRISGLPVVLALGALLLVPGAARAVASTQVKSVRVSTVDGRTTADVTVVYPDAAARRVARGAINRGIVRVVVKNGAGRVLARRAGSAELPVDVPRASSVQQTYRFALPATVAKAEDITVHVAADGHLDPDGPGPEPSQTDRDHDQVKPTVQHPPSLGPKYQYHEVHFFTGGLCDYANERSCAIDFWPAFSSRDFDNPVFAPFVSSQDRSDWDDDLPQPEHAGQLLLLPARDVLYVRILERRRTHSSVEGRVYPPHGQDDVDLGRFYVDRTQVNKWSSGSGSTGTSGQAGRPGAPLNLTIAHGAWTLSGYIGFPDDGRRDDDDDD